jgi:hypothetical protein
MPNQPGILQGQLARSQLAAYALRGTRRCSWLTWGVCRQTVHQKEWQLVYYCTVQLIVSPSAQLASQLDVSQPDTVSYDTAIMTRRKPCQ